MSRIERDSLESLNSEKRGDPDSWFEEWSSTPPLLGGLPNPPKTHRTSEIKIFDSSVNTNETDSNYELPDDFMLDYYYEQIDSSSYSRMRYRESGMSKKEYAEHLRLQDARMIRDNLSDPFGHARIAAHQKQRSEREQADSARKRASQAYSVGETIFIQTGEYAGYSGTVEDVDIDKGTMKVHPNPTDNDEWVHLIELSSKK